MTKFIARGKNAAAINDIPSGADVRCGVACRGSGALDAFLGPKCPPDPQILCDVALVRTYPEALVDLPASCFWKKHVFARPCGQRIRLIGRPQIDERIASRRAVGDYCRRRGRRPTCPPEWDVRDRFGCAAIGKAERRPSPLAALIVVGEGERLEFKETLRWDIALAETNRKLEDVVARSWSPWRTAPAARC